MNHKIVNNKMVNGRNLNKLITSSTNWYTGTRRIPAYQNTIMLPTLMSTARVKKGKETETDVKRTHTSVWH